MYRIVTFLLLLLSTMLHGQSVERKVQCTIEDFFKGFHIKDTTLMRTMLYKDIKMQTILTDSTGIPILKDQNIDHFLKAVASIPINQQWEERLLDFTISIDGNMAHAWVPYEFWYNGTFSHCGVNSFQLFYNGKSWKITNITDTRHKKDCSE